MTISLSGAAPKAEVIDQLRRLLQATLFPHLPMADREAIIMYFAWMKEQKEDLQVGCELRSIPELQLVRVNFEFAFKPIPPTEVRQ